MLVIASNCAPRPPVKSNFPIVIVGLQCGIAVMRGSQVYAAGVTAVPAGNIYIYLDGI